MIRQTSLKANIAGWTLTRSLNGLKQLLLTKALLVIVPFYLLQSLFDFPQVLDKRAEVATALYRQNELLLGLAFGLLALSGLAFAAASWWLPTLAKRPTRQVNTLVWLGGLAGGLQFLSYAAWPLLGAGNYALIKPFFVVTNQLLATFLLAAWTFALALYLRQTGKSGRGQTWLGLLAAVGLEVSLFKPLVGLFGISLQPVEFSDFDWATAFNLVGQVSDALWLVWLVWLALTVGKLARTGNSAKV